MTDTKTLILMRHAKSEAARPGGADHERALDERGRREAARIGGWLVDHHAVPDLILCSTARRARETVELAAARWEATAPVYPTPQLYLATPEQILRVVKSDAGAAARVMVVGHNPGMEYLVGLLTGACGHFPTAATVVLEHAADDWADVSARRGWTLTARG